MLRLPGMGRRTFLQLGAAGLTSLTLPRLAEAKSSKDTRVIVLWLEGGPSHMDLWDMKPDAPAEYRGFWRPIGTNVAGIQVSEMLPRQARIADKFSILRTLNHKDGDHIGSAHILLTGRPGPVAIDQPGTSPSMGSIVAKAAGARRPGLPPYVAATRANSGNLRPGYFGAHYLGRGFDPFETGGYPNSPHFKVENLAMPNGLTVERLDDRRALRKSFDDLRRAGDSFGQAEALDQFERQAFELVTSKAVREAFSLSNETEANRARYGRNDWGQSVLLAKRLAEAGVTYTTVNMGGWDQHGDLKAKMDDYLPKLDMAVSALFQDLAASGSLENICVVVMGEMSRTPRMNAGFQNQPAGRDHWNDAISLLIGGGGVKGGRIVGKTDARGEQIVERPASVGDLHATIYHVLGIDPYMTFPDNAGRPVPLIDDGAPIRELL
ncbi:MAG TPA: DUF1501 domain-containing protein [Planctomycetota bacterium]